jgi:hypothetical protein
MGIHKDRPSRTGVFEPGSQSISANRLNQIGQYLDQSRTGIHSGSVRPSETAGGTLIEVDIPRRRSAKAVVEYHPWQIVYTKNTDADGNEITGYSYVVWPATVNNYVPKFQGEKINSNPKPKRTVSTEGKWSVWLEVKGEGSQTQYVFPKEDGETPLIIVDQQESKGNYDDKAYLLIATIDYKAKKEAVEGVDGEYDDEPAQEESITVAQFATLSNGVERIKCGQSPAQYFWYAAT